MERFDLTIDVSFEERLLILRTHYPVTPEDLGYTLEESLARPARCGLCGQLWDELVGCPTRKAIILLGQTEARAARTQSEAARRIDELSEALHGRFRMVRYRAPDWDAFIFKFSVDKYTMFQGKMDLVDHVLYKVRQNFQQWWDDVGAKQRLAADHRVALLMDDADYRRLQSFDPSAPGTFL